MLVIIVGGIEMKKEKEDIINEIVKTAGIKDVAKTVGRTATGALLGAGIGANNAVSENEKNPYADVDERNSNIAGKAIGGALVGGAIAGPGIGAVKFGAKKIKNKLSGITKKSEMQVPTDEETGKETKEDRDEVLESPNEQEKRRMNNSITKEDELKEYYKNKILDKAEQIRKGE